MPSSGSSLRTRLVQVALVGAAYFALARFGLSFAFETTQVTAVWPPTGLALAALMLMGPRAALGIYAGAFAANLLAREPLGVAAGIALGNTATGLAGWWLMRKVCVADPSFGRIRDVLALTLAAVATPLASASGGVGCLVLGGQVPASAYESVWRVWWMGDALGILLVAPLLLTWVAAWGAEAAPGSDPTGEKLLLLLGVVAFGVLVFCGPLEGGEGYLRAYLAFPLLIWAALRFAARETVTTAVGISAFAVWGAIHARGPFGLGPVDDRFLQVDAFIGIIGLTALLMGAATAERQEAQRRLVAAHGELERKVEARTAELARKHEEVEGSRRFLETVVEHLPVALVVKSARIGDFGAVELWNPAAERIFGVGRSEALGRTPPEFLAPGEGARVMEKDREVAASGEPALVPDGAFEVPGQGIRHLRTTIVPVEGEDGAPESLLTISMDISEQVQAERALKRSEEIHRAIVESLTEGVVLLSQDDQVFACNSAAQEILGLSPDQMRNREAADPRWQMVHEDGKPCPVEERPARVTLATGQPVTGAVVGVQKPDGTRNWLRVNSRSVRLENEGASACVVASFADITLEKYYRESLAQSEARYARAAESGHTGILDLDLQTNKVHYSASWKSMLGFASDEVGSAPMELLGRIHPEDIEGALRALKAHIRGETPEFQVEIRVRHRDGRWLWLLSRGLAMRDARGRAVRVTGSQTDITAQKAMEARLHEQAIHDELTGLYNRRHFNEAFRSFLLIAQQASQPLSLAVCDLDRFKQINDTHGHPAGDEVIRRFARMISGALRGKDLAARIGGDEFCVLFPFTAVDDAARALERVRERLAAEVFQGEAGAAFSASATFGVAGLGPSMAPDALMRAADEALYEAKKRGRNQIFAVQA